MRTPHGKRRASVRRGWAGEKSDFFSILLELGGERSHIGYGNDSVHDGMDAAEVGVATGSQPWKCKVAVWQDDSRIECAGVPIL